MPCREDFTLEDLYAWLDGQLDDDRHRRYEEHLDGCEPCGGELEQIRSLETGLERHLHAELSPAHLATVPPASFRRVRIERLGRGSRIPLRNLGTLAAAASIVATAVWLVQDSTSEDPRPETTVALVSGAALREAAGPAIRQHKAFFSPLVRSSDAPQLIPVPSPAVPSWPAAVELAGGQDRVLLGSLDELTAGWQAVDRSGDGEPDVALHTTSGREIAIALPSSGLDSLHRVLEAFRDLPLEDVGTAEIAEAGPQGAVECFLSLETKPGFVRVLTLEPGGARIDAFPSGSQDPWYPSSGGPTLLPPAEPVVELLEEGRFVYASQLEELGDDVFLHDRGTAFRRAADGLWRPWDIDVLPYPRPIRVSPGSVVLVLTTSVRPQLNPDETRKRVLLEIQEVTDRFGLDGHGRTIADRIEVVEVCIDG